MGHTVGLVDSITSTLQFDRGHVVGLYEARCSGIQKLQWLDIEVLLSPARSLIDPQSNTCGISLDIDSDPVPI